MKKIGWVLLGACLILGACSDTKKVAPKEGRISVIFDEKMVQSNEKVHLDKAVSVVQWGGAFTNTRNKIPAIFLDKSSIDWKAKGATGRSKNDLPMVTPVALGDKIYTLDNEGTLFARSLKDGKELWHTEETKAQGVGLAVNKNGIVVLDENGIVRGFDTKGKKIWQKELKTPFRSSPLLDEKSLYLLSFNNDLWVLDSKNGNEKWHYKTNAPLTLLQEMGRPALSNEIIVVPFSTGEVVAFNAKTGVLLWSQDLVGEKVFDAVAGITQMSASPVIENDVVYLVGHGGITMAVNIQTGETLWQIDRGGETTPLVSGNVLFFVDNKNTLLAINKKNGKLFWETKLKKDIWKGPYLINNKLLLFSDNKTISVNPKNGEQTALNKKIEGSAPAITTKGIYFMGDNGTLYHWGKI